jgi:hypothetical protein
MGERGQTWSMDLIIGVLIFMLAIGVIYALLASKGRENTAPLRIESEVIATKLLDDPQIGVTSEQQLDATKLGNLTSIDYETLRQQLGVQKEFCIFLQDESGNITYIVDNQGRKYTGIGSGNGDLNISGVPCGQVCTTC